MEQKVNITENLTKAIALRHPDAKAYLKSDLALSSMKSNDNMLLEAVKNGLPFYAVEELFAKIGQIEYIRKAQDNLSAIVIDVYDYLNEIEDKQKNLGD